MSESRERCSILIVEDDPSIREALKLFLELEGYRVLEAANGQAALEVLSSMPPPRLVLLDLMMPIMDGYEFLGARARNSAFSAIPVVVVSAFVERVAELPIQGYVAKPIDFDHLLALVSRFCG